MYNTGSFAKPVLRNTIVWGNNTGVYNNNGAVPEYSYCLVQGETSIANNCISSTDINENDVFVNLVKSTAGNPTTAGDYSLKTGSPAINKGSNAHYNAVTNAPATDLAGTPRIDANGTIDMGAYEYHVFYTVIFYTTGGSTIENKKVARSATIGAVTSTRSGYVLEGWYTEAAFVNKWNVLTDIVGADMNLYAKWITAYTVTFESNGGTGIAPLEVASDSKIVKPADPAKDKHTFAGWYKDEECTSAWNFATDVVASNITLYAKWTEDEVGITETVAEPIIVYSTPEGIVIKNAPAGETIRVYNISGILIVETQCLRLGLGTEIAVPKGIYIIKVGNAGFKRIKN